MEAHELINQTSGEVEYYTPPEIIAAARRCMGQIDLDPASSDLANIRIGATKYFTEAENGLDWVWPGNVWMNHPFGRKENPLWINHLMREFSSGRIASFCCITYACTSEAWFQPLFKFRQCFLSPRTNYYLPDGTVKPGVTKGSVVTFGSRKVNEEWFDKCFEHLGYCK